MGGSKKELPDRTIRHEEKAVKYGMEVSSEKDKVLTNSTFHTALAEIGMNGQVLDDVVTFKYLVSLMSKDGSISNEIKARLAATISKLNNIGKSHNINIPTKVNRCNVCLFSQWCCKDASPGHSTHRRSRKTYTDLRNDMLQTTHRYFIERTQNQRACQATA